jgi:hypothetical protein
MTTPSYAYAALFMSRCLDALWKAFLHHHLLVSICVEFSVSASSLNWLRLRRMTADRKPPVIFFVTCGWPERVSLNAHIVRLEAITLIDSFVAERDREAPAKTGPR